MYDTRKHRGSVNSNAKVMNFAEAFYMNIHKFRTPCDINSCEQHEITYCKMFNFAGTLFHDCQTPTFLR